MPRPKKTDKKPVEKPKKTAKRRKDKEEDHDDLEEFEEKLEKKLKVEVQNQEKAKICVLGILDQRCPGSTVARVHTFKNLASALEFREGLIREFEGKEGEEDVSYFSCPYFDKNLNAYSYDAHCADGPYGIRIKEVTVDELQEGLDVNIFLGW